MCVRDVFAYSHPSPYSKKKRNIWQSDMDKQKAEALDRHFNPRYWFIEKQLCQELEITNKIEVW